MTTEERFWSKVDKTATCWLWTGARVNRRNGYGRIRVSGKLRRVHRLAYEMLVGPIPADFCVCHTCDVENCVNPQHLFLGTPGDNYRDCVSKGRHNKPRGEYNGNATLTEEQIWAIRSRRYDGESIRTLARSFGTANKTIEDVIHGRTWRHVQ